MRVRIFPAAQDACFHYRQAEPARIALAEGWDVEIGSQFSTVDLYEHPKGAKVVATARLHEGQLIAEPIIADLVILQRPAKATVGPIIEAFHRMGAAVVVDLDDDLAALRYDHPLRDHVDPALNPQTNHRHLRHACALADLVTVTTPALAERYGAHGRVAVLPNCVPERLLEMGRSSDGQTLGWAGYQPVHPGDLEVTHGAVPEALARTGWRYLAVGPPEGVGEALGLEVIATTGGLTIEQYYEALGALDVGIAPLADTAFNRAKSGLKVLESLARGVACVASDLPEYASLAAQGIGMVVPARGRSWRSALVRLMSDAAMRAEMVAEGRERVREAHTFETQGWRWLESWTDAISIAAQRHAVAA